MFSFLPALIVRNPIFSFKDYPASSYSELLNDSFFQASLYIASPAFYKELKKIGFDYSKMNQGQRDAIRRYHNRACFRPTPFGMFSTLAPIDWTTRDSSQLKFSSNDLKVNLRLDYLSSLQFCERIVRNEASGVVAYRSNTTLYKVFKCFRYIKHSSDAGAKRVFSIISLFSSRLIADIIDYCSINRQLNEIIEYVQIRTGSGPEAVADFILQLVEEQVIVAQSGNNITGNDSLEELIGLMNQKGIKTEELDYVESILARLRNLEMANLAEIVDHGEKLREMAGNKDEKNNMFYVVAERGQANGGLSTRYQQVILDGLHCLSRLIPSFSHEGLDKFRDAFFKKFENREVPLLMALDPEVGVGYENLENRLEKDSLLKDISFDNMRAADERQITWTSTHTVLLNKLNLQKLQPGIDLEITDADLEQLQERSGERLPPSISVMFRVHDDKVYLENAGGVSAVSLMGRFSPFNPQFLSMLREVAAKEQEVNKEVVFAEIAHICDAHAANINRRQHIRDYEIPVLVASTLGEEQQIGLSDLYLSVRGGEVLLTSKRLNAVVVPRLSSAFNHVRNDLSVFRFLCDLQYQGLKVNFKLELSNYFPGLRFYPRVVYKSAILHLATWHLNAKDFAFIKNPSNRQRYNDFFALAKSIGLVQYFALVQSDNHLVFNLADKEDVELFLNTVKNSENIILNEYILDENDTSVVENDKNTPLISQFVAMMHLDTPVYEAPANISFMPFRVDNQKFMPGTEWLYFKIYCHPVGSNDLLCDILLPMMEKMRRKKDIDQWFFVRYRDPQHHLRVRLHVDKSQLNGIIFLFNKKLEILMTEGIVDKFHIDTYMREIDRYPSDLIRQVETVFFNSSRMILHYIKDLPNAPVSYSYNLDVILLSIDTILNAFNLTVHEKVGLFNSLYQNFYSEFSDTRELKRDLEKKYNDLRKEIDHILSQPGMVMVRKLKKMNLEMQESLEDLAALCRKKKKEEVDKLIADIIHMHLNRLFVENPRKQELVIYYILHRHFSSSVHRSRLLR